MRPVVDKYILNIIYISSPESNSNIKYLKRYQVVVH